ncbi:MAG: sirohydrochlorin chelatase [Longimicrobiales bacterium]
MLILIAHGSRDPAWRASLEGLTREVRSASPGEEVQLVYMQFTGPTLPDVVEEGWKRGVRRFRILPLFMASAGHVDKDIRPLVGELAQRFPGITLELLTPVGESPLFPELVRNIAENDRS